MSPSTLSIISLMITFLSLFTTIDARRSGFLFICFGSGCEGWEVVLTIFSIFVTIFCCCLCMQCLCNAAYAYAAYASNALCNENDADTEERGTDNCRNKDTEEISKA